MYQKKLQEIKDEFEMVEILNNKEEVGLYNCETPTGILKFIHDASFLSSFF